jgi:glycosyltransferase involved in cell wall biosynthesis
MAPLSSPSLRCVRPLRLVLVTRRFWPLVGGAERVMANLAVGLAERGHRVTLLTARWQSEWPAEITYSGVPVVRMAHPPQRFWGTLRYMRALARWLRRHAGQYDLVYVSMLKHDAYAALQAVAGRVPVVLRAEGAGKTGDCVWQLEATCGRRIKHRCMKAAALVGPSRAIEQELKAAGYPRPRIHYIPNGVRIPAPRDEASRREAREALATLHADLNVPEWAPLGFYTGRLHAGKGLSDLVAAWEPILARWPNARLCLAGDGPYRTALEEQIEARNLGGRVILAGTFDSVDELLAAADVFVLPSLEEGMSLALLEAMAAGLPVVATDIPGNRDLVTDAQHGLLVPPARSDALAAAIQRVLDDPELAARLGAAARQRVVGEFSLEKSVEEHVALFEGLTS